MPGNCQRLKCDELAVEISVEIWNAGLGQTLMCGSCGNCRTVGIEIFERDQEMHLTESFHFWSPFQQEHDDLCALPFCQ